MSDDEIRLGGGPSLAHRIQGLLAVGQLERALQAASDAVARQPDDPLAHFLLGTTVRMKGADHLDAALAHLAEAIRRDPTFDMAHAVRGEVLIELGRFAEAEQAIRTAMELDPHDAQHHSRYAWLLSICDRDEVALAHCEHALSLEPDDADLHQQRATLLLFVDPSQWKVSEEAVRTALRMDPQSPMNHAILGTVQMRAGERDAAEHSFRTCLRTQPTHPLALRGLSEMTMARNPLYRPLFWFSQLLGRLGQEGALGVLFALWALFSAVMAVLPPEAESARQLLTFAYLGFAAYTWFAGPITRALLRRQYPWLE